MAFASAALGALGGSAIGSAVVRLALDTRGYDASLAKAKGETVAGTSAMGASTSKFSALAQASMLIAGVAVIKFAADSVRAFNESQNVMAQTTAVIESTGGAAGYSAEQIAEMASALQQSTAFSDEQVQSAENLLLTFTSIGHDAFPTATEAVLDMSTALGQDLKTSSIQLGKALNDPIAGLTSLKRVGVAFSEDQVKQIQLLVQQNDLFGAQTIILDELAKEFGGSAAAAAETFTGQTQQLANAWDDLQEKFGEFLTKAAPPMLEFLTKLLGVLDDINPVMKTLGENVVDQTLKWDEWSKKNVVAAASLDAMVELFSGAVPGVQDLTGGLDDFLRSAGDTAAGTTLLGGTVADFGVEAGTTAAAVEVYTEALRDALTATLANTDATFGIIDAFVQDQQAATELADAQEHLNKLTDKGTTSGKEYREAQQAVADAALASTQAHADLIASVADLTDKFATGETSRKQAIRDLKDMADSAGLTKEQTQLLVDELKNGIAALNEWNRTPLDSKSAIISIETRLQNQLPSGVIAAGGIIGGASGFITGAPTYLVGEGGYATPFGKGAEAVLPLNGQTMARLGAEIGKHIGGGGGGDINIYNAGSVVTPNQLIDDIQEGLIRKGRRGGSLGLS